MNATTLNHDITPIPDTEELLIKPTFQERYEQLLGKEGWKRFLQYSFSYLRKCIRVNTIKISVEALTTRLSKDWDLTPVPWCKEGFWIKHKRLPRFDLGNLPEHQLGYFYIQEAASMIPPVVLSPQPEEIVLDLCAAPGSKTSQLAQYMHNKGVLVANDADGLRLKPLGMNLQRCGTYNTILTRHYGQAFAKKTLAFDRVLCDAPCSGTGTIRRSLKTLTLWSPGGVRRLAGQQRQLLKAAYAALKPGGTLVYSTCTCEPEENEGNISWLLQTYPDLQTTPINLPINASKPIMAFEGQTYHAGVKNCLRIWPQDNDTEGFFIAKIYKSNTT
ncbi:RsmB/NOP family class I SAM-dependent RNA methyltransferase [Candidatus Woesearchaeota archaeon]|nr:MAG: RsmB/NOP family class I SAM-dependent RNA methyltransferase [Candidatus Woesearchaeota archaeon]